MGVTAHSKNQEAAITFVEWFSLMRGIRIILIMYPARLP